LQRRIEGLGVKVEPDSERRVLVEADHVHTDGVAQVARRRA